MSPLFTSFNEAASDRGGEPRRAASRSPRGCFNEAAPERGGEPRIGHVDKDTADVQLQRGRLLIEAENPKGGFAEPVAVQASTRPPLNEAENVPSACASVTGSETIASTRPPLIEAENAVHGRVAQATRRPASTRPPLIEAENGRRRCGERRRPACFNEADSDRGGERGLPRIGDAVPRQGFNEAASDRGGEP